VTEPGDAQAGLWACCKNSWIGVKRAQRMPGRPRCSSEKETRAHFEQERGPAHLGFDRIDIPVTISLGWKKGHHYSMVDRTSRFLESTTLAQTPTGGLLRYPRPALTICASHSGISADCVEIGNYFRSKLKPRSLEILAQMLDGRCSRDHQDVGRPLEKPG